MLASQSLLLKYVLLISAFQELFLYSIDIVKMLLSISSEWHTVSIKACNPAYLFTTETDLCINSMAEIKTTLIHLQISHSLL